MKKLPFALLLISVLSVGACEKALTIALRRSRRWTQITMARSTVRGPKRPDRKVFAKLNPDGDGTLDAKELSGRLPETGIKAADPDNDGTLNSKSTRRSSPRSSRLPTPTATAPSIRRS